MNSFDNAKVASEFDKFFANIGITLVNKIRTAKAILEAYLEIVNSTFESNLLSINELKMHSLL